MRLLIINFEMNTNSPVLAWPVRVVQELAPRFEQITVLTEIVGTLPDTLPSNVHIEVMPRRPLGIPRRLGSGFLINRQLDRLIKKHKPDACFIHMAHRWAYRFWPTFKRHGLPVLMWYAHGAVTWHLKLALAACDAAVTSTPQGLRLNSPKVHIIGQGIDANLFSPPEPYSPKAEIVSVGRLSPSKRQHLMLEVLHELRKQQPEQDWNLVLAGPILTGADTVYQDQVLQRITALGLQQSVTLTGALTQAQTVDLYKSASIHLNLSQTGSMDKTVLESLACGCPTLTTNIAFADMLRDHPLMFSDRDEATTLAQKIIALRGHYNRSDLRGLVVGQHDLAHWCDQVHALLRKLAYKA